MTGAALRPRRTNRSIASRSVASARIDTGSRFIRSAAVAAFRVSGRSRFTAAVMATSLGVWGGVAGQYGAGGPAEHFVGDAAEQEPGGAAAGVGLQRDHVVGPGLVQDRPGREFVDGHAGLDVPAGLAQAGG